MDFGLSLSIQKAYRAQIKKIRKIKSKLSGAVRDEFMGSVPYSE
jgi:hypothetical protein